MPCAKIQNVIWTTAVDGTNKIAQEMNLRPPQFQRKNMHFEIIHCLSQKRSLLHISVIFFWQHISDKVHDC